MATKHEWHEFSYNTLDEFGIGLAEANRTATLSALATIDDDVEYMTKREEATKDPKVQVQLARMQLYRLRQQSTLDLVGPIPMAPQ